MLIIKPIQEKSQQQQICEVCLTTYRPECFAYSAFEGETLIGICQFAMSNGKAELIDLKCVPETSDEEALFIMARAMMSFVEKCGIAELSAASNSAGETPAGTAFLKKLGFKQTNGVYTANLSQIFKCRNSDAK